jgi:Glycosyltransferase
VGRLVREKGVFELLSSYAKLDAPLRDQVGLVFVGEGRARRDLGLQASAIAPGKICFAGFVQRESLIPYYALAEMLILPTYTDTWGLVVNEAMACSLPVILTNVAGCAPDLVTEDWNGHLVPPRDVDSLAERMRSLAIRPNVCVAMGNHSANRIANYSPAVWSTGILAMTKSAGGNRD